MSEPKFNVNQPVLFWWTLLPQRATVIEVIGYFQVGEYVPVVELPCTSLTARFAGWHYSIALDAPVGGYTTITTPERYLHRIDGDDRTEYLTTPDSVEQRA